MNKILFSAFKEDQYQNNCQIEIQYIAGSYFDPKGKEGTAHFMEHILINPTDLVKLKKKGVNISAFTNDELVYFSFNGPYTQDFEYGIRMAFENIRNILKGDIGRFTNEEIEKERELIKDEIKRCESDFEVQALQEFYRKLYTADHPYVFEDGKKNLGSEITLQNINLEDLKTFFENNIKEKNPIVKVYYEGKKENYDELIKEISKIIESFNYSSANEYPYTQLDKINTNTIDAFIDLNKGDKSYMRVYIAHISDSEETDPLDKLLVTAWRRGVGTIAYKTSRDIGIAYQINLYTWLLNKKRVFLIQFSLKNEDADNKLKKFESVLKNNIQNYLSNELKSVLENYKIDTKLYPVTPLTNLDNEISQYKIYKKKIYSLEEIKEKATLISEERLKGALVNIINSPSHKVKVVW